MVLGFRKSIITPCNHPNPAFPIQLVGQHRHLQKAPGETLDIQESGQGCFKAGKGFGLQFRIKVWGRREFRELRVRQLCGRFWGKAFWGWGKTERLKLATLAFRGTLEGF